MLRPGDTVILDNLQAHKVAGVREAIEAVGARVLYLPPYSPEFNPIEQIFAKLKHLLRNRNRPHRARPLGCYPRGLHPLHPRGMPQLHHRRRLPGRLGRRYIGGNSSKVVTRDRAHDNDLTLPLSWLME